MISIVSKKIKNIHARQILDSRGNPTIEVDVHTDKNLGRAAVPSGASKGIYEAVELRDGGKAFNGRGVSLGVDHINKTLNSKLRGLDVTKQKEIDELMISIDGTKDKSRFGANSILGVSLAVARCGANVMKKPLYAYLGPRRVLPVPFANCINGGKHAGSALKLQEFMLAPVKAKSFSQATQMLSETYSNLKDILLKKYGKSAINVGDEGGFVPPIAKTSDALKLLVKSIDESGYGRRMKIAIDAAASEFYNWKTQKYNLEGKRFVEGKELVDYYLDLIKTYPIVSLEDPFDQDDFGCWQKLMKKTKIQVVGDDLLATNKKRTYYAIDEKLCNALLLKVNQIGTLSEAIEVGKMAFKSEWKIMVSHRSGESNDAFISDLAVGLGTGQIKMGAPCRGERVAKFNRLLRIEEELKHRGKYLEF